MSCEKSIFSCDFAVSTARKARMYTRVKDKNEVVWRVNAMPRAREPLIRCFGVIASCQYRLI
jgi:predicted aminopeptidase